jgi:hypothetical protein
LVRLVFLNIQNALGVVMGGRDMHLRTTNIPPQTSDVFRFSFGSAGVLVFENEYSGFAVRPARYIAFEEHKHA